MTEVVTLGECLISLVASTRGPMAEAATFERTVTGAEANVAVGLARLGRSVAYVGRVGDDAFGTVVLRRLRAEGVDISRLATEPGAPTGVMFRELRELVPMEVIYHRAGSAASHLGVADVDGAAGLLRGARWVHLTGITPALSASAADAVRHAVDLAREGGATISLDLNIRRRLWSEVQAVPVLRDLARSCHVVLGGLDEIAVVGGLAATLQAGGHVDPGRAAASLLGDSTDRVVVKLGAAGALELRSDGSSIQSAGFAVPHVVDPVGAGDAFTAGYIALTLEGAAAPLALRAANACGAAVVASVGDLAGLLTRTELATLLSTPDGPDTTR
jgi:2-dehydro-3-deoxygluconokinase